MGAGAPYGNRNAEKWNSYLNNRNDFNSEKEYHTFIEDNIELFCEDVINLGKYINHKSNQPISRTSFKKPTIERIDLFITGTKGSAIVEIKYPNNYFCEMRNAISQLLYYSIVADENAIKCDKLIIVSPVYDERIFAIIAKFNLSIELVYLTKEWHSKIELEYVCSS